jgi:chromosome partitioning protein
MSKAKIFHDRIKKLREEIDFTQQDLADEAGVNLSIIKQIEAGRAGTSKENMVKIAKALNSPLDKIYLEDFRETKVITCLNSKGGCAKTTVVTNLGYELAQYGYKVLLIDADLQCNLTYSFKVPFDKERSIYRALINADDESDPVNIFDFIKPTGYDNLDIIISDFEMATVELDLTLKSYRETIMIRLLQPLIEKGVYDFIIFDTNPMLGLLNQNILSCTDRLLIPVELSPFGVMGLDVLFRFVKKAQKVNSKLEIMGIIETKVDKRYSMTEKAETTLKTIFAKSNITILESYIPTDSNVINAQWDRMPLSVYSEKNGKHSRANKQFKSLAKEVLSHE